MNHRVKVVLNTWQQRRLQKIRDRSASPHVVKRAICLLLSADGAPSRAFQQATGLSLDAITDIRHRWRRRGRGSLEDRPRSGRPCDARLLAGAAPDLETRAARLWVPVHRLEPPAAERPPEGPDRPGVLRRIGPPLRPGRGVRLPPPEAHPQGPTRREGVPPSPVRAPTAQKGALRPDANYELWFQDEAEFHLHPYLTAMWMPRGRQRRVPTPGKNRKVTVFGAWCYGRGLFRQHTQPCKNAWGVRQLVQHLVQRARQTGRRILLVMDQGCPHHAKALKNDLQLAKEHMQVFWLPHYSPELNLIERLWRHLKRSRLANVLFRTFPQFLGHAAFANPEVYEFLEAEGYLYTIRLPQRCVGACN